MKQMRVTGETNDDSVGETNDGSVGETNGEPIMIVYV